MGIVVLGVHQWSTFGSPFMTGYQYWLPEIRNFGLDYAVDPTSRRDGTGMLTDSLNGALLREAAALGIKTPYNEALVALLKGRELHQRRKVHEPELDYEAWEARIAAGAEN